MAKTNKLWVVTNTRDLRFRIVSESLFAGIKIHCKTEDLIELPVITATGRKVDPFYAQVIGYFGYSETFIIVAFRMPKNKFDEKMRRDSMIWLPDHTTGVYTLRGLDNEKPTIRPIRKSIVRELLGRGLHC